MKRYILEQIAAEPLEPLPPTVAAAPLPAALPAAKPAAKKSLPMGALLRAVQGGSTAGVDRAGPVAAPTHDAPAWLAAEMPPPVMQRPASPRTRD